MDLNKWIEEHTIVRAITGSRLYGTAREDSDTDYRGVCLDPPESIIGIVNFGQREYNDAARDEVIYSASKFVNLCMDANPSILDILFVPRENIVYMTYHWLEIAAHRNSFLSQKVRHTFSGYAFSQLKRIQRHKRWIDNPPQEPDMDDYGVYLHTSESGGQRIAVKDYSTGNADAAIALYKRDATDYTNYKRWRDGRNQARAALEEKYGYDVKHAGHLVRLLLQGKNILSSGTYKPALYGEDLEVVQGVINGEWDYDYLVSWAQRQEAIVKEMPSSLRKTPDIATINRIMLKIAAMSLGYSEDFCKLSAVYCNAED